MKKVFLIHGFKSSPNSSWLPWVMGELKDLKIYACSLCMPTPDTPKCAEWVQEISRHVNNFPHDDIYLVGHSLGVAAILNYLQSNVCMKKITGAVLVSGRSKKSSNPLTENFYMSFDFKKIQNMCDVFSVIHGDNDHMVDYSHGIKLSKELGVPLITVTNGGHLSGADGFKQLPQALDSLTKMLNL